MSDTKLKPCPFCGGEAILDREDIFCDGCHLSMRIDDRVYNREAETFEEARKQAIEDWNTRKPMDRIVKQLEENALVKECDIGALVPSSKKVVILSDAIDIVRKGGVE